MKDLRFNKIYLNLKRQPSFFNRLMGVVRNNKSSQKNNSERSFNNHGYSGSHIVRQITFIF